MDTVRTLLEVRDLSDDSVVATTPYIPAFEIDHTLSKTGTMGYTSLFNSPDAPDAIVDASGGADSLGIPLPYMVSLSIDGGATYDFRQMLGTPITTNVLADTTDSLFRGYTVTGVDRVTYHGVALKDVLYGAPGTIKANGTAGSSSLLNSVYLPYQKGIFRTIPGLSSWAGQTRLGYIPKISSYISDVLLNNDNEADYIDKMLETLLTQVVGVVDASDPLPIGSRAQWFEDSSDAALNLAGVSPSISIGHAGTSPWLTFTTQADPTYLNQAQILEQADQKTYIEVKSNMDKLLTKVSYVGGQTNHGLPQGANILSPIIAYPSPSKGSTNWGDNLCFFIGVDSSGFGGVYYWPHDGAAYQLGGSLLNPKNMVYYKPNNSLYVATDLGVYTRTANTNDTSDWSQVGGLGFQCKKVEVAENSGIIITEVSGTGSADGIYCYPNLTGDTGGSTSGYDGWSCLTTGSFTAWNYTTAGDTLNFVDTNSPSVVTQVLGVTDPTSSISRYVLTPNASTVIDLEQLTFTYNQNVLGTITPFTETGTVVTTAEGSLGIYYLSPAAQYYDLNPDLSLVDATDLPVSVNSIINFSGDYILGNLTIKPVLFALTDSGVYFTQNPKGGSWQSLGQQSGITDQNITGLAVGQPQTLVTHIVTRLYATSSSSLWCSHTGGIFWDDEVADTITVGAYLSELGKLIGQIPFLNNTVTSIGTAYSTAALGTSGTNIPGPLPAPYNLDGDLVWERVLDEHNKWTYRLVHTASAAPYAPIEFGEVTELVTDSATNHFVASGILAKAKVRYLGDKSRLQVTATVRSSFARTTHKLRTLRPTHLVNLLYIPGGPFPQSFSNTPLFVINHKLYKTDTVTQNSVYTETVLSSVLRTAEITMNEVVDGLIYVFGKAHRKAGKVGRAGKR